MTSVLSWPNSLLAFALLCFVFQGQTFLLLQISLDFLLLHSSPLWSKGHLFFLVLVLEGLVGLHKTVQLQLLQHYWLGIVLGQRDIEWFALEMNRDHSVTFEIVPKYCMLDSCCLWFRLIYFLIYAGFGTKVSLTSFLFLKLCW